MITSDELLQKYFIVLEKLVVLLERQNGELVGRVKDSNKKIEKLKEELEKAASSGPVVEDKPLIK